MRRLLSGIAAFALALGLASPARAALITLDLSGSGSAWSVNAVGVFIAPFAPGSLVTIETDRNGNGRANDWQIVSATVNVRANYDLTVFGLGTVLLDYSLSLSPVSGPMDGTLVGNDVIWGSNPTIGVTRSGTAQCSGAICQFFQTANADPWQPDTPYPLYLYLANQAGSGNTFQNPIGLGVWRLDPSHTQVLAASSWTLAVQTSAPSIRTEWMSPAGFLSGGACDPGGHVVCEYFGPPTPPDPNAVPEPGLTALFSGACAAFVLRRRWAARVLATLAALFLPSHALAALITFDLSGQGSTTTVGPLGVFPGTLEAGSFVTVETDRNGNGRANDWQIVSANLNVRQDWDLSALGLGSLLIEYSMSLSPTNGTLVGNEVIWGTNPHTTVTRSGTVQCSGAICSFLQTPTADPWQPDTPYPWDLYAENQVLAGNTYMNPTGLGLWRLDSTGTAISASRSVVLAVQTANPLVTTEFFTLGAGNFLPACENPPCPHDPTPPEPPDPDAVPEPRVTALVLAACAGLALRRRSCVRLLAALAVICLPSHAFAALLTFDVSNTGGSTSINALGVFTTPFAPGSLITVETDRNGNGNANDWRIVSATLNVVGDLDLSFYGLGSLSYDYSISLGPTNGTRIGSRVIWGSNPTIPVTYSGGVRCAGAICDFFQTETGTPWEPGVDYPYALYLVNATGGGNTFLNPIALGEWWLDASGTAIARAASVNLAVQTSSPLVVTQFLALVPNWYVGVEIPYEPPDPNLPLPEPGVTALLLVACAGLALRRRLQVRLLAALAVICLPSHAFAALLTFDVSGKGGTTTIGPLGVLGGSFEAGSLITVETDRNGNGLANDWQIVSANLNVRQDWDLASLGLGSLLIEYSMSLSPTNGTLVGNEVIWGSNPHTTVTRTGTAQCSGPICSLLVTPGGDAWEQDTPYAYEVWAANQVSSGNSPRNPTSLMLWQLNDSGTEIATSRLAGLAVQTADPFQVTEYFTFGQQIGCSQLTCPHETVPPEPPDPYAAPEPEGLSLLLVGVAAGSYLASKKPFPK